MASLNRARIPGFAHSPAEKKTQPFFALTPLANARKKREKKTPSKKHKNTKKDDKKYPTPILAQSGRSILARKMASLNRARIPGFAHSLAEKKNPTFFALTPLANAREKKREKTPSKKHKNTKKDDKKYPTPILAQSGRSILARKMASLNRARIPGFAHSPAGKKNPTFFCANAVS